MNDPDWRKRALCQDDPLFQQDRPSPSAVHLLKATCGRCPVRLSCAGDALELKPTWGVWAGQVWTKRGRSL